LPAWADQSQEEEERFLDRELVTLLVDEEQALARAVEDRAEVGADRGDEPLRMADRLAQGGGGRGRLGREAMRGHRLDPERPEEQREDEGRGGVAVVDDESEPARADRVDVELAEQILGVPHADPRGIRGL